MASKRTHDVVATVGTYKKGDEEKKRYLNVGSAFTNEKGDISIKLDAVPVTSEWSGWISLYPVKEQGQRREERPQRQQRPAQGDDDEIPF